MTSYNTRSRKLTYFGETYKTSSCNPAQSKVSAITAMPGPTCKKQVQSFIGMINYLFKCSAQLSELVEPIWELSKEKVPFNWGPENQSSFTLMKKEIAKTPTLAYYNPKQTVLQTDVSIEGLGACLLQDKKPVYFASNALTEAQKGYIAIELESLAVVWAMKKFHHFLYASYFILETDQKPLEAILSKSLNQATRMERILIRTFSHHFTVHYIPGLNKTCWLLVPIGRSERYHKASQITLVPDYKPAKCKKWQFESTKISHGWRWWACIAQTYITQGWPSTIKEVPNVLQPYWTFQEVITVQDGVVLKGTRIVIPSKKHEAVWKLIHEGHLGLNKCKLHAKDTVYWPDLNDQLEKLILNCELCLKYSQSKCKQQPSLSLGQQIPLQAWTKLVTDIFHFEGASYLLIVDYTIRFQVVYKLSSMTGQHVATHCKQIFSKYGWPETLIYDNGPCYTAETFTSITKEYGVNPITSSPHYPQSNGLAEKLVQIVKNLFDKAK